MFTGIIEEVGKIKNIQGGTNYKLTIGASKILEDIHLGDSIAVNGICLTAISWLIHRGCNERNSRENFSAQVARRQFR